MSCAEDPPTGSDEGGVVAYSKIAFTSGDNRSTQVFIMNPDGSGVTQLTDDAGRRFHPDWSPDGTRLIYSTEYDFGPDAYSELYIINVDGTNPQLVPNSRNAHHPAWSPDGDRVAFHADIERRGNLDIYVMNLDGTNLTRVTTQSGWDVNPDWSPDGMMISYESSEGTDFSQGGGVYVMNT